MNRVAGHTVQEDRPRRPHLDVGQVHLQKITYTDINTNNKQTTGEYLYQKEFFVVGQSFADVAAAAAVGLGPDYSVDLVPCAAAVVAADAGVETDGLVQARSDVHQDSFVPSWTPAKKFTYFKGVS